MAGVNPFGPNRAATRTTRPFTAWDIVRPHLNAPGGPWTWTHYGIYIPRLPEPLHYLNVLALFGAVDLTIFKHPKFLPGGSRPAVQDAQRLTTIMSSTAARDNHFDKGYDILSECDLPESGTSLRWGRDLSINFDFVGRAAVVEATFAETDDGRQAWGYTLHLSLGQTAVWFVSTPYYDHLAIPAHGTLRMTTGGHQTQHVVSGSLEFARCKPAPIPLKTHQAVAASTKYFIYHVVELDNGTQILWGEMRNAFVPPRKFAFVRSVPDGRVLEAFTTELQVEVLAEEMVKNGLGQVTRVPRFFSARVVVKDKEVLEVKGRVNTPLRDGAGGGYVAGYSAAVRYRGEQRTGWGMFEWVDLELTSDVTKSQL